MVGDRELDAALTECEERNAGEPITVFEITTAAGLLLFARHPADILLLEVGLGGRLAALGIVGIMAGAASTHVGNGFFMNWFGSLPAGVEGFEYHVIAAALALVVAIEGSGALSIDRWLARALAPASRAAELRRPIATSRAA